MAMKETKKALRDFLKENITSVLSSEEFWAVFDEVINEQIALSTCKIDFLDSELIVFVGGADAHGSIKLEEKNVDIWPSIYVIEDIGENSAREVSMRMGRFIKRLQAHKAKIDEVYNLKGDKP